jgi:peroxiredoxin family protein
MQALEERTVPQLKRKKLVIICSKGSLDMAYPPLMLATTAAAMGMEVHLYFTFWGMNTITKKTIDRLKISSVGNGATNAKHPRNDPGNEWHGDFNDEEKLRPLLLADTIGSLGLASQSVFW